MIARGASTAACERWKRLIQNRDDNVVAALQRAVVGPRIASGAA